MKCDQIAIMGTPVSSGNRGVLALGASLANLCVASRPGVEVFFLLLNREARPVVFRILGEPTVISVVNARMSPLAPIRRQLAVILLLSLMYRFVPIDWIRHWIRAFCPWIEAVATAELVGDVRGGDSFSDIYGLKRFLLAFLPVWSVLLIKGSVVLFPQTYGPFKSPIAQYLARFLLRRASVVMARDRRSQAVAQALLTPGEKVVLSPDVAFSLERVRPDVIKTDPLLEGPMPAGVLGLNINGLLWHGGYTRDNMFGLKIDYASFLKSLVPELLREHSGELWLIPHTFAVTGDVESDPDACRAFLEVLPLHLQQRVRILIGEYDQYEIKGVIGQCEFFIGSRMHACIAALSQGVPCVGVAYSEKFAGVFESVNAGDWVVDGRTVGIEAAVKRVVELYGERQGVRAPLVAAARQAGEELRNVFRRVFGSGAMA